MMDAFRRPQSVIVLGGNSDIAAATLRVWARGSLRSVFLGVRDPKSPPTIAAELSQGDRRVVVFRFDAAEPAESLPAIGEVFDQAQDIDVALLAFGILGDQSKMEEDPSAAEEVMTVNATATVVASLGIAQAMKSQGHGVIVVLSSAAGQRPRRDNYVYGASKAAIDSHARGLASALSETGVEVLVVRAGFVRTKMTRGLIGPMPVDPANAGQAIVRAIEHHKSVVWVPRILAPLFVLLRLLPEWVWRRLANARVTRKDDV